VVQRTINLSGHTMIEHYDTNTFVKFRLTHSDGTEVQPLWLVLATLRKHGFRTLVPRVVRSGPAGSFLVATACFIEAGIPTMAQRDALRFAAMRRVAEELGQEAVSC
jgi:hypothetical protein